MFEHHPLHVPTELGRIYHLPPTQVDQSPAFCFFQRKWLHDHPNPVIQSTQTYAKTRLLSVAPSRVIGKHNKAKTHNLVQNNVEDSKDQGKRSWFQALTSLGTAFSGAENLPASRRRPGKSLRRGSWNRCAKLALNINARWIYRDRPCYLQRCNLVR